MRYPFFTKGGKFPYTNFNNVNLDWMLKQLKKIDDIAEIDTEALKKAAEAAEAATEAAAAATAAAQTATATAEAARQTAQGALDTAEGIADTADSALSAAQAAQTTAGDAQTAADNALTAVENSVSFVENQSGKTAAEKERARRNSGQHEINIIVDNRITAASESAAAAQATADSALDSVDRSADLSITIGNASNSSTLSTVGSIGILSLSVNVTDAIPVNTWTTLGQLPSGVVPVAITIGLGRRGLASTYSPLMARVTTNRNIQVSLDYAFDGSGSTSIRAVVIFAMRRT